MCDKRQVGPQADPLTKRVTCLSVRIAKGMYDVT